MLAHRCNERMAKMLLVIFNVVFLVCGLGILLVGLIDIRYERSIREILDGFSGINIALFATGGFICLVSSVGCCGALAENTSLITLYVYSVIFLIFVQLAIGVVAFYKRNDLKQYVKSKALQSLDHIKDNRVIATAWDELQLAFSCCGAISPLDYTVRFLPFPASCCGLQSDQGCYVTTEGFQFVGCERIIEQFLRTQYLFLGTVTILIAFIEVLGIVYACCLQIAVEKSDKPSSIASSSES